MICGDAGSPLVLRFGEKGMIWLDVFAVGRAAHGAHVHLGESATERLLEAISGLLRLRRWRVSAPAEIPDEDLFACPFTFMGVPYAHDLSRSRAAILGIPFDCGAHPVRIGARYGPQAIREQSRLVRPYQPPLADFNPLTRLGVVDCGNVRVTPSRIEEAFERIEEAVWRIAAAGAISVTMGGDGAVTLPQLRALHRKHPDLVVLHIHGLAGLNFAAFDVNTVSPPHDVGGMTAFLAGTVMLECFALACAGTRNEDRHTAQ